MSDFDPEPDSSAGSIGVADPVSLPPPDQTEKIQLLQSALGRPVPRAYGRHIVGGNVIYQAVSETDGTTIYMVALGEGEWDSLETLWVRGLSVDVNDTSRVHFHPGVDGELGVESDATVRNQKICSFYPAAFSPQLTFSRVAYLSLKLPNDPEAPDASLDVRGIYKTRRVRVFDGSGNQTAYRFEANPAWVVLDLLISGWLKPHGAANEALTAAEKAKIDFQTFVDAASICAAVLSDGKARFEAHVAFTDQTDLQRALEQVLLLCRGYLIDRNGKVAMFVDQARASAFTADRDKNIAEGSLVLPTRDTRELANRFTLKFRALDSGAADPAGDFQEVKHNDDDEDHQDQVKKILTGEIDLGNSTLGRAVRLGRYMRNRSLKLVEQARLRLVPSGDGEIDLLPGDRITGPSEIDAFAKRDYEILEITDEPDGSRDVAAQKYDENGFVDDVADGKVLFKTDTGEKNNDNKTDTGVPSAVRNFAVKTDDVDPDALDGKELIASWTKPLTNANSIFAYAFQIHDAATFPTHSVFHSGTGTVAQSGKTLTDTSKLFGPEVVGKVLFIHSGSPATDSNLVWSSVIVARTATTVTVEDDFRHEGSVTYQIVWPDWAQVLRSLTIPTRLLDPTIRDDDDFRYIAKSLPNGTYYCRVAARNLIGLGLWSPVLPVGGAVIDGFKQNDFNQGTKDKVESTSPFFSIIAGTFTNNSPVAGSIAWSGIKVHYKGSTYLVSNGNTSSKWLVWKLATPTVFSGFSTIQALGEDEHYVAINEGGTAVGFFNSTSIHGATLRIASITADLIAANTITANKLAVAQLSAIAIDAGALTAGTLTGLLIRTAASGARVEIDSTNGLRGIDALGSVLSQLTTGGLLSLKTAASGARVAIDATNGIQGYNSAGTQTFKLGTDGSGFVGVGATQLTWVTAGTVTVFGGSLVDGSVIASKLTENAESFVTNISFSASSNAQVDWTAGTITFADSDTFSILAGNTGVMTALTYIYFDPSVSTTVLQVTTIFSSAVAERRILVAIAQNVADTTQLAFFVPAVGVFGLNGSQISANAISTAKLQAGSVTAAKISVAQLSAIAIDAGALTAGTLTGLLIRTAASGARIELTAAMMDVYNASGSKWFAIDPTDQSFTITGGATNDFQIKCRAAVGKAASIRFGENTTPTETLLGIISTGATTVSVFNNQQTVADSFHITQGAGAKFGFGTVSPTAKLHVKRGDAVRTDLALESAANVAGGEAGALQFVALDSVSAVTEYARIVGLIESPTDTVEWGRINFQTREAGALTTGLTIKGASVGINKNDPARRLHVVGGALDDFQIRLESAIGKAISIELFEVGTRRATISAGAFTMSLFNDQQTVADAIHIAQGAGGKIGIGTAGPLAKLHVVSAAGENFQLRLESAAAMAVAMELFETTTRRGIMSAGATTVAINEGGNTIANSLQLRQGTGEFGVGKVPTSGGAKLQVSGGGDFTGAIAIGNAVNVVSPTAPDRTVTISIGGTTIYLHGKTTNN